MANIGICTSHYALLFKLYVSEFIQAHYNNMVLNQRLEEKLHLGPTGERNLPSHGSRHRDDHERHVTRYMVLNIPMNVMEHSWGRIWRRQGLVHSNDWVPNTRIPTV